MEQFDGIQLVNTRSLLPSKNLNSYLYSGDLNNKHLIRGLLKVRYSDQCCLDFFYCDHPCPPSQATPRPFDYILRENKQLQK